MNVMSLAACDRCQKKYAVVFGPLAEVIVFEVYKDGSMFMSHSCAGACLCLAGHELELTGEVVAKVADGRLVSVAGPSLAAPHWN